MNSQRLEPEDLVALDRRGQLDVEQADQLERLYCEDPRTAELYRWGRAFDVDDLVQPGDELLVSRSVERALRVRVSLKRQKKPRIRGWWLLAAILAGSSAAAAGMVGFVGLRGERTPSTRTDSVTALEPSGAKVVRGKSERREEGAPAAARETKPGQSPRNDHEPLTLAQKPQAAAELSTHTASGAVARHADIAKHSFDASGSHTSPSETPPNTTNPSNPMIPSSASMTPPDPTESRALAAEDLFRAANEARRKGDLGLCIRRYRELQQRFATSAEAQESHVSLGKVLQSSGDVAGAVQEFSLYLQRPGALEEESLVGLAEALDRLGRNGQARSTWQRLLDRYPNSVYAARARRLLTEPK